MRAEQSTNVASCHSSRNERRCVRVHGPRRPHQSELSIGMCSDERQATPLQALSDEAVACRACELAGYLEHANQTRPGLIDEPSMLLIGPAPAPVTDRKSDHYAGPDGPTPDHA